MKRFLYLNVFLLVGYYVAVGQTGVQLKDTTPLLVKKCTDFTVNGKGDNTEWNKTAWTNMTRLDSGGKAYTSRFKMLYSAKGVYVLFAGDDDKISTTYENDFENLFRADVFEVFFHPDPKTSVYFEYEINQLNSELVLLIPSINGRNYGWIPWHYEKERRTAKMVNVVGGKASPNAAISSWTAEIFFPYPLFAPLGNIPPASGITWNANFYRLDYDSGKMVKWAWGPVERSFHELNKFRAIRFE